MSHIQMSQSEKSMVEKELGEVGEKGNFFLKTSRDLKKALKVFEKFEQAVLRYYGIAKAGG